MNTPWNQTKRAAVRLIRHNGPTSRIHLAAKLRLTKAAITPVVQDLLDEGVLSAGGQVAKDSRGRRQELLKINAGGVYGIGLSIGLDYLVELVIVDVANNVVFHKTLLNKAPTQFDNPKQYARIIAREIKRAESRLKNGTIAGIGISISGSPTDDGQWLELASDFSSASEANDFLAELRLKVSHSVSLVPDVASAVLAEHRLDASLMPMANVMYVNDRLGVGLILDGRLSVGNSAHPRWLGHFQVDPNGIKCFCGRKGCLATNASLFAITDRLAGFEPGRRPPISKIQAQKEVLELGARYNEGNPAVKKLTATAFENLGLVIRSLATLFSLDLIVIGAWAGITPERELERLRKILSEGYYGDRSNPKPMPALRWSAQGKREESFGAAILEIDRVLESSSNLPRD